MKRNILYIAAVACLTLGFSSCSDDPLDASSKHVYGEDETPYLRTNTAGTISKSIDFTMGKPNAKTISLKDYAEVIQTNLKMTVDDMLSAVETGAVAFHAINSGKSSWDKAEPTKGTAGWYFNSSGAVCSETNAVTYIELDKTNKALVINAMDAAPAMLATSFDVGFAIDNGENYDDYVRFSFNVTITDRAAINLTIPAGGYAGSLFYFADYAEEIEAGLGVSADEFTSHIIENDGTYNLYMIDGNDNWVVRTDYTATGYPGWWCLLDGTICSWNDTGFSWWISTETESEDGTCTASNTGFWIGTVDDTAVAPGSQFKAHFVYVDASDDTKFVEFNCVITKASE